MLAHLEFCVHQGITDLAAWFRGSFTLRASVRSPCASLRPRPWDFSDLSRPQTTYFPAKCLLWVESRPPQRRGEVRSPWTCERDLIWTQGLCRWNRVETRVDQCPREKGKAPRGTDARGEDGRVALGTETGVTRLGAQESGYRQELGEASEASPPCGCRRERDRGHLDSRLRGSRTVRWEVPAGFGLRVHGRFFQQPWAGNPGPRSPPLSSA